MSKKIESFDAIKRESKQELIQISGYCAFKLSQKILEVLLIILSVTLILCTDDSVPAFYLLAANLFLPKIIEYLFSSVIHGTAPKFTMLAEKYHYTFHSAKAGSTSFVCICLLLYLWQKRILGKPFFLPFLNVAPTILLFIFLSIRIVGQFYYRHKLHKMLLYCTF